MISWDEFEDDSSIQESTPAAPATAKSKTPDASAQAAASYSEAIAAARSTAEPATKTASEQAAAAANQQVMQRIQNELEGLDTSAGEQELGEWTERVTVD